MYDKKIKMLLLILNRRGLEINWETKARYSQMFDAMVTSHQLKFWHKGTRKNKEGKEEEFTYCKTIDFHNIAGLIKYLLAVKDDKTKAGEEYEEE